MTDDRTTKTRADGRRRVCVVGNSFLGALRRARDARPAIADGYDFAFFASAGQALHAVEIRDGCLTDIEHRDSDDARIRNYDAVVLYGDCPVPKQVVRNVVRFAKPAYSAQLRRVALDDWFSRFATCRLARTVVAMGGPKVYVLSRNTSIEEDLLPFAEHDDGVARLREFLGPAVYVPVPRALFLDDGRPDPAFYAGSLDILGVEPDRDEQPAHHKNHFNVDGGAIVLEALIAALSARVSG